MAVKRVAVIGAGVSGLVAIKSCVEDGLEPVCFEREDQVGGVWVFRDEVRTEHEESALYHALVTNSSKEMMCYSDFPFPKDCPPYIPGKQLGQYYKDYAEKFGLLQYIRFGTSVLNVEEAADYDTTGRWSVTTRGPGGESTEVFDAVMVCTGMFSQAKIPKYPGQDEFEGDILHSNDYRKSEGFEGKTVLVVGGSHSAGDVAVDTSRKSKKTYISMRNGTWVITRTGPLGWPRDLFLNRRFNFLLPEWYRRSIVEKDLATRLNSDNLGLKSTRKLFCSEVMVNDDIANRIFCGAVSAKPGIKHFTKRGVVFTDGTKIDDLDVVIYATGYNIKVPFVGTHLIADKVEELDLYMYVFPSKIKHPTFACIGFVMTIGAHAPVFELQARWATQVFKGKVPLPSQQAMATDIAMKRKFLYERYGKHIIFIPPIPYQDCIASKIGAKPNFKQLFLKDPMLALKCFFGPAVPPSYRLVGPHTWSGARDAIMNVWQNTVSGTKFRETPVGNGPEGYPLALKLMLFVALVAGLCLSVV
ncbi:dimethylaniline monooxygenase [N-oxide-forming] 2-like [Diadema antillarum]|uniref:dimethylaniline monooxygenase [N-oxide-forming] 2-like n=1 Tax=Diadema antillarum TaxID=105358 RepID=UPI003A855726